SKNSSKDFTFCSRQYCPARTSHRHLPSSTKRVSRSASLFFSQARISSILVSTNMARRRLSFGSMGGFLVSKLVKPTKAFGSRSPHEGGIDQLLFAKAESQVGARAARVLREPNATVGQKLCGFDSPDCVFDQLAELVALLLADGGSEILDLDQSFADEYDLC